MGGLGSGRKPDLTKQFLEPKTPIGNFGSRPENQIFFPNFSGDHSAGHVSKTPAANMDLVNKAYVDSVSKKIRTFNVNKGAVTGPTYLQSNSLSHSSSTGIAMNRAGSLVGVSITLLCSAFTSTGEAIIEVKINDTTAFTSTVEVTGTGSYQVLDTKTSGAYPVAVGDYIQVYLNYGLGLSGTFSNVSGNVEVDTE